MKPTETADGTTSQERRLLTSLVDGAVVVVCAVAAAFFDLPQWLLPCVFGLSLYAVALTWGWAGRRAATMMLVTAICVILGAWIGEWNWFRVNGEFVPYSNVAFDRWEADRRQERLDGAWLGGGAGLLIVLAVSLLRKRQAVFHPSPEYETTRSTNR